MADILLFKNKQDKDDFWAGMKKDIKGEFVLNGLPLEIIPPVLDRMRLILDGCVAAQPRSMPPFSIHLSVTLSETDCELVKKQIEAHIRDVCYPMFVAKILIFGVLAEVANMENELFRLRKAAGE